VYTIGRALGGRGRGLAKGTNYFLSVFRPSVAFLMGILLGW